METTNKGIKSEWYYFIKWVAIISMFITHFAQMKDFAQIFDLNTKFLYMLGRPAFLLFSWELVQHFYHNKTEEKRIKTLKRLGFLAIISQPLYDLCYGNRAINVIGTLAIGWILMILFERAELYPTMKRIIYKNLAFIIISLPFLLGIRCDYDIAGFILILLYYRAEKQDKPLISDYMSIIVYIPLYAFLYDIYYDADYLNSMTNYIIGIIIVFPLLYCARKNIECKFITKINKVFQNKIMLLISRYFYPLHLLFLYVLYLII